LNIAYNEVHIRHLYNKLADYEMNRGKCLTFAIFYPELIKGSLEAIIRE